jgi:SAM-dependent methyltransferase
MTLNHFNRAAAALTAAAVTIMLGFSASTSAFALSMMSSNNISKNNIMMNTRINSSISSRAQFLKTATIFTAATSSFVTATDPVCALESMTTSPDSSNNNNSNSNSNSNSNPRYLDSQLEMKYGTSPNGNPRTRGILVRRFTGDNTPFTFPNPRPVSLVKEWPQTENPPFSKEDFLRADQQDDGSFYAIPRFVYHIDEAAVSSLTQYYRHNIAPNSDILDICSSWTSHYPLEFPKIMKRISATGMNALELRANDQLTDFQPKDLNIDYKLPYDDESFDVVTIVVSIDYLISPIEVLKEVRRVLRSGGKVIISQSNRCFPSKAIAMWLKMNDRQHLELINGYLQYAGGFLPRKAFDITASGPDPYYDPMFIIEAVKA